MSTITLSQLPQPDVIEVLDFETILAERKAYFVSLYPADQQASVEATLALESEPIDPPDLMLLNQPPPDRRRRLLAVGLIS